ncbi:MAG: hypothetical protein ACXWKC_20955, partial [Xanthobacteraceae bacterium]
MAFRMASLIRSKSGAYAARKGIPKDVREEYLKLYGQAWEALFLAPAGLSHAEAKARHGEWLSEIESRVAAIRSAGRGEGLSLTKKEALALAGEWYRWFVARHEEDPGEPMQWWWQRANFRDD